MKQTKKRYSPEFKARVAIEALKEHLTLSELVSKFGVNSSLIYRWKQEFIHAISRDIFDIITPRGF